MGSLSVKLHFQNKLVCVLSWAYLGELESKRGKVFNVYKVIKSSMKCILLKKIKIGKSLREGPHEDKT